MFLLSTNKTRALFIAGCTFFTLIAGGPVGAVTSFTGTVVDGATNTPIPGAKVVLTDTSGIFFQSFTDAGGGFLILTAPGVYSLRVSASGYPLQYYNPQNNTEISNFRLTYDGTTGPVVTVKLTQNPTAIVTGHGWITGNVMDSSGSPLANIDVNVMMPGTFDVTAEGFYGFHRPVRCPCSRHDAGSICSRGQAGVSQAILDADRNFRLHESPPNSGSYQTIRLIWL